MAQLTPLALAACALTFAAVPLAAQQVYGSAELSFGNTVTAGAPVALQGARGDLAMGRAALTLGQRFANGLYLQADLGALQSNNGESAPNTLNAAQHLVLRAGRDAGGFGYGAFAGVAGSDHDTDATDDAMRMLAGVEGAWAVSDRLTLDGHLGYLTGDGGSDSVATATNGVFTGLGLQYAASNRLSLGTSIGYLNAKMDAPATVVELWTLEARVDYQITAVPGLSVFAAAQYGESHQKEIIGPDDITDTTTIMAGLTYRFGKGAPKTAKLGYLAPFLSNSGGILE